MDLNSLCAGMILKKIGSGLEDPMNACVLITSILVQNEQKIVTCGIFSCFHSQIAHIHFHFLAMTSSVRLQESEGCRSLGVVLVGICCTENMAYSAGSLRDAIVSVCPAEHQAKMHCCRVAHETCT